jgi:hypothetical protein
MDCVKLDGKTSPIVLLTHQAKLEKLQSIFAQNKHKSDLFLPDENFYGKTVTVDDPERMADLLFKWLAIKHRSLTFHINPNQEQLVKYEHAKNIGKVYLGWHCLEDSLVCGAAVAHAIIHHLLIARAKIDLGEREENEALTDFGTIHGGLGVLIINSFESKGALGSMAKANYLAEFLDYCREQRIVDAVWQPFVLPDVTAGHLQERSASSALSPFIRSRLKKSQRRKLKSVLSAAFILVFLAALTVVYLNKPAPLSPELREKQDTIAVLKAEIVRCQDTVKRKEQTWDQTDIFIQRQIDADKTRCASLTSRYNYELSQYNSNL